MEFSLDCSPSFFADEHKGRQPLGLSKYGWILTDLDGLANASRAPGLRSLSIEPLLRILHDLPSSLMHLELTGKTFARFAPLELLHGLQQVVRQLNSLLSLDLRGLYTEVTRYNQMHTGQRLGADLIGHCLSACAHRPCSVWTTRCISCSRSRYYRAPCSGCRSIFFCTVPMKTGANHVVSRLTLCSRYGGYTPPSTRRARPVILAVCCARLASQGLRQGASSLRGIACGGGISARALTAVDVQCCVCGAPVFSQLGASSGTLYVVHPPRHGIGGFGTASCTERARLLLCMPRPLTCVVLPCMSRHIDRCVCIGHGGLLVV